MDHVVDDLDGDNDRGRDDGAHASHGNNDNEPNLAATAILRGPSNEHQATTTTTTTTTTTISPSHRLSSSSGGWLRQNAAQITAMLSNFSTSYNVVNISLVLPILEQLHPDVTAEDAAACASSLLAGMMVGQLAGGALGDTVWLGRLGALRLVMALQVGASLASASLGGILTMHGVGGGGGGGDIFLWLAAWRFVLGVGCGGVYPLAAVLSAEQGTNNNRSSNRNNNNRQGITNNNQNEGTNHAVEQQGEVEEDASKSIHRVVLTFSTQGLGFVTVPIVAIVLLYCTTNLNLIWRSMLGLGAVPGLVLMVLQGCCLNPESGRYAQVSQQVPLFVEDATWDIDYNDDVDGDLYLNTEAETDGELENGSVLASDVDEGDIEDRITGNEAAGGEEDDVVEIVQRHQTPWMQSLLHEPGLGRKVLGTAGTWFLFDVVFYGNTIFQPIVVEAAFGGSSSDNPIHLLQKTAIDSLILTSIALPGYAVAGVVIGKKTWCVTQTPRYVMLQGFAAMAVLYLTIGINWSYLRGYPALLVFLYGGTFFFANYGPNTSTFILPSLLFEKEHRATWNGVSAAAGKLGALTGASLFAPAAGEFGDSVVMMICAGVAVVAYILTFCFVPKQGPQRGDTTQSASIEPTVRLVNGEIS